MQSSEEETGGARTEPQGDGAVLAGREPVAEHDQAASADDELASADDQAAAAENLPMAADHEAVAADDQAAAERLPLAPDRPAVVSDEHPVPVADRTLVVDDQPVPTDEALMIVTEDNNHDGIAGTDDDGHPTAGESEPEIAAVVPAGPAATGGSPSAFASGQADDAAAGRAGIGSTSAPDANQRLADEATPTTTSGFSPEPGSAQVAGSVSAAGRWPEIQAMFVDDPRASVELAADLVDDSLDAVIASVKQLQSSLRSIWGSSDADTEQLRTALQRYRACWRHLQGISIEL